MSSFSISILESTYEFESVEYEVKKIIVTNDTGQFFDGAHRLFMVVTDGTNEVNSFITEISINKKNVVGVFTTDAFASLVGTVDIQFGNELSPMGSFQNIDLSLETVALPAGLTLPQANNAWLAALT